SSTLFSPLIHHIVNGRCCPLHRRAASSFTFPNRGFLQRPSSFLVIHLPESRVSDLLTLTYTIASVVSGCRLIHQTCKKQTCLCSCCNRRTVHLMDEIEILEIVDGWPCTSVAEPVELAEESNADIEELEFQVPGPLNRCVQLAENKAHMDDLRPLNHSRDAQVMETSRCPVSSHYADAFAGVSSIPISLIAIAILGIPFCGQIKIAVRICYLAFVRAKLWLKARLKCSGRRLEPSKKRESIYKIGAVIRCTPVVRRSGMAVRLLPGDHPRL
ncbi:hypothetical protein MUK42_20041, partial [Musa troglodytarum]